MTNQIEFRHLEYFLALSEELHFGRAAERLYISQSALSQQIQRLEHLVGRPLFDRTNRRVELNRAGELFKKAAQQVTHQLSDSLENWKLALEEIEGVIRIGFVGSAMREFLPPLIKEFSEKHPQTQFSLDEMNNQSQLQALEAEQLDVGFVRSNQAPQGMNCKPVYTENLCMVLPENHTISAQNFKDIGQFSEEKFILFPNQQSQMYYQQIIKLCQHFGFTPSISHRSIHGPTIFKLVESGMGISIVPKSLMDDKNYKIRFIELDNVPFTTSLFAVWNPENAKSGLKHFLDLLFG
ncbi:LysR family transcriptional regulator [Flagellimonas myxillae]|uniref:LysR family transcriptional regulator n=1 Tax=Flagellimonas myxillae TaxID=2942214 RepID=UPI00201EED4E|nr:LysR family transcriptional regulator [Muricauda myxillae]MCL6265828.1 LysR family transcriptional regulator [Muricauda myxillae]